MLHYRAGRLTSDLVQFIGKLRAFIDMYEADSFDFINPIIRARRDFKLPPKVTAEGFVHTIDDKLGQFQGFLNEQLDDIKGLNERLNGIEFILNQIRPNMSEALDALYDKGIATFIDGENEAFYAITEMVMRAKVSVRTTQFFPHSLHAHKEFLHSLCDFGKKSGVVCKHIICMNEASKTNDLWTTVFNTYGGSMEMYLTKRDNNFDLYIVDDIASFLCFYDENRRIKSTLFVKSKSVVREFEKIYDHILCDPIYGFHLIVCRNYQTPNDFVDDINYCLSTFGMNA